LTILLVVSALICAPQARCELVTLQFTGKITNLEDPYCAFYGKGDSVHQGASITGTFTYDTSATDLNPLDNQIEYRYYQGPSGVSIKAGEVEFRSDLTNVDFYISITDNAGSAEDRFFLRSYNNTPLAADVLVKEIEMEFAGAYAEHLISGELPTEPQTPRWFGPGVFFGIRGDKTNSRYFQADGGLTNLWLVPEPATLPMLREKTLDGDVNSDGIVNFLDVGVVASQWLMTESWYGNSNSVVKDGIEYYVQTDKSVYHLGEDVELLYRVSNLSEDDVEFIFSYGPLENTCDWMVDKDQLRMWDNLGRPSTDAFTSFSLSPSESFEYSHTWNMTDKNGDDILPGNYNVTGVLGYRETHDRYVPVSVQIEIIPSTPLNSNSVVKDGIEYCIQTDKPVYNSGEDVEIMYRVTNLTETPLEIAPILNCYYAAHLVITDGNNTEIWEHWRLIPPCGFITLHLDAHESKEYRKIWNMTNDNGTLGKDDDFPIGPGSYHITGELHLGGGGYQRVPVALDIEIIPTAPECDIRVTDVTIFRSELVGNKFARFEELHELTVGDVFVVQVEIFNFGHQTKNILNLCGLFFSPENCVKVVASPWPSVCAANIPVPTGGRALLAPLCSSQAFKAEEAGHVVMHIYVDDWNSRTICDSTFTTEILSAQ